MNSKFLRRSAYLLFPIALLYGILVFLYSYLISDAVLSTTLLLDLSELILWWWEPLLLTCIFAVLLVVIYQTDSLKLPWLYLLCGGALAVKYICATVLFSVLWGSFEVDTLPSTAVSLTTELLIGAVFVLISYRLVSPAIAIIRVKRRAAETLGTKVPEGIEPLPFSKILSFKNPLLSSGFYGVLILTAVRLVNFIIDDISYGMYQVSDIPYTLLYLFLYVLIPGVLCYFLFRALVSALSKLYDR